MDLFKWNVVTVYYPRFQIETHDSFDLFKEGGDGKPDRKHIRVATIYKGRQFNNVYVLEKFHKDSLSLNTTQLIISKLKREVKKNIDYYRNNGMS